MRSGRSLLGTGVAALLVAGVLPALTSTAHAVAPDKVVLLGGSATTKTPDVIVANADGSGQRLVHKGTKAQAAEYVALAPTNNRIAEIFADDTKTDPPDKLAVMNRDGSRFHVLATSAKGGTFDLARFNPAGTKLLVSVETEDSGYLAIVNLTAAHPTLVRLKGSTGLGDASFSTQTDNTVVASDESGALMTLTGGVQTLVLDPPSDGFLDSPTFSPDGQTIAVAALTFSGSTIASRIETVSSDGNVGPTTIVSTGLNLLPLWSSDGGTIYYTTFNQKGGVEKAFHVPATGGTPTALAPTASKNYLVGGVAAPDSTPTAAAPSVKVTLNGAKPVVSWTLPTDADVSHVVVRRLAGATSATSTTDGTLVYSGTGTSVADKVTAGQTYTYAVWVVDGSGNYSADHEQSFVALGAPTLKAPPLVSSISKDTTFHVSWAPNAANPGGTTYQVDWLNGAGTWIGWQNGVTTTAATFGAAGVPVTPGAGKTYKLRAYVTDTYGNTSSKSSVAWVEPKDDRTATAKGSWAKSSSSNYWLGTARTTTHANTSLSISLTGSTLWIIGDRLPNGSHAVVYVDGVKVATISTLGQTTHRHVLWTKKVKSGKHSVRIVNLATKHHTHLSIDGFAAS